MTDRNKKMESRQCEIEKYGQRVKRRCIYYEKGEREKEMEGDREGWMQTGNTNSGEKLCTVDLLLKEACFVKKAKYIFN